METDNPRSPSGSKDVVDLMKNLKKRSRDNSSDHVDAAEPSGSKDGVDLMKKLKKRAVDSKFRAKKKNEIQEKQERLGEVERMMADYGGEIRALRGELDRWHQSGTLNSVEAEMKQVRSQLTTAHQIIAGQQQTIAGQQLMISELQQQLWLTQQQVVPPSHSLSMINDDLARGHTLAAAEIPPAYGPVVNGDEIKRD